MDDGYSLWKAWEAENYKSHSSEITTVNILAYFF
jgi:hypothetical protein